MPNNPPPKEFIDIRRYFWISIIGAAIIGILMIGFIGGYLAFKSNNNFFASFGSGVLIAGGSLLSGGFLGFIFGIPSILQDATARVRYNDNLVQISDWLTKIIVGVGLTQLYSLPHFVLKIGEHYQVNFGNDTWGRNVSIAIIGFFFILGFLMIYFWTKTDYSTVMKTMDDEINKQLMAELQTATQQKDQAQLEKKEMANDITKKETQNRISVSSQAADAKSFDNLMENNDYKEKLLELKQAVEKLLPLKPIVHSDDLQKDRWGGKTENNGRKVSATVAKNAWQNLFDVVITVANTNNAPLTEPAAIFLHDSYEFPDNVIYATPSAGAVIQLSLLAYESFTLGVLFADGTELELDLGNQPGFPKDFYAESDA